jgi:acetyl esterase/lipase
LAACGVATELHVWPGAFHGYDAVAPDAPLTDATWATRLAALERAFDANATA